MAGFFPEQEQTICMYLWTALFYSKATKFLCFLSYYRSYGL